MHDRRSALSEWELAWRSGSCFMTLFQIVSEMADDARGFRSDVHEELADLVATYKLPARPEDTERKIRCAAGKVLDSILIRSFDQTSPSVRATGHAGQRQRGMP